MTRHRILIVDDDRESCNLLKEVLETNGYDVSAVHDGKAARNELNGGSAYRTIIADLRMPGESGIELLRDLRSQKPAYNIVLMSSFISESERTRAVELGVDAMLEKPFRLSELLHVVSEVIGKNPVRVAG